MKINDKTKFKVYHHPIIFLVLILALPIIVGVAYYLNFNHDKAISILVSLPMLVIILMVLYIARDKLETEIIITERSIEFKMLSFWPFVRSQVQKSYNWAQVLSIEHRPRWGLLVLDTNEKKYSFLGGGLIDENKRLYSLIKKHISNTGLTTGSTTDRE